MKFAAICETAFHFQDKIPPIDYAVDISSNMHVSLAFMLSYYGKHLSFG